MDLRCRENNRAHRTWEIDRERLIVRRGQPFSVTLQGHRPLTPQHYLDLVLHLGEWEPPSGNISAQRVRRVCVCVYCPVWSRWGHREAGVPSFRASHQCVRHITVVVALSHTHVQVLFLGPAHLPHLCLER